MDMESLKRVLLELKGEARKMRKAEMGSRFKPFEKKEEDPAPEALTAGKDEAAEEPAPEPVASDPSEETDAKQTTEPAEDEDETLKGILARLGHR